MWDDEQCTARDVGGNLGGECGCSGCVLERETLAHAVAQGIPIRDVPLLESGRVSYDGVKSLPPRTETGRTPYPAPQGEMFTRNGTASIDGIDRSRYVYEGPNGTPRDPRDYSPHERLRVPLVLAAPPDTPALREALSRAQNSPLPVVTVEIPHRKCVCGVDLDELAASDKLGHICSAIQVDQTFGIPTITVREAQLEQLAREFAEASPSLLELTRGQMQDSVAGLEIRGIDHDRRREATAKLRRIALQYAAAYLALDAERYGGDYVEAIEELRDPTIEDVK